MTVYVITTMYAGRLANTWCYSNRDEAVAEYNRLCEEKSKLCKRPKETYQSLSLFGDRFDRVFEGSFPEPGMKSRTTFQIKLSGRDIKTC